MRWNVLSCRCSARPPRSLTLTAPWKPCQPWGLVGLVGLAGPVGLGLVLWSVVGRCHGVRCPIILGSGGVGALHALPSSAAPKQGPTLPPFLRYHRPSARCQIRHQAAVGLGPSQICLGAGSGGAAGGGGRVSITQHAFSHRFGRASRSPAAHDVRGPAEQAEQSEAAPDAKRGQHARHARRLACSAERAAVTHNPRDPRGGRPVSSLQRSSLALLLRICTVAVAQHHAVRRAPCTGRWRSTKFRGTTTGRPAATSSGEVAAHASRASALPSASQASLEPASAR